MDAENKLKSCLDMLLLEFGDLSLSTVFESEAVGFEGDNFLNMVVGMNTDMPLDELSAFLKAVEENMAEIEHSQNSALGRLILIS